MTISVADENAVVARAFRDNWVWLGLMARDGRASINLGDFVWLATGKCPLK